MSKLEDMSKQQLIKMVQEMKMEVIEARNLKEVAEESSVLLTHTAVGLYVDKDFNHQYIEVRYNPEGTEAKVVKKGIKTKAGYMARKEMEDALANAMIDQLRSK